LGSSHSYIPQYALHVMFTHPDYIHLSPRALGIVAESPLYVTTDPPRTSGEEDEPHIPFDPLTIPKAGVAVPVPEGAWRLPGVIGDATSKQRPNLGDRTWAYL
jgi:hypothetical protein